MNRPTYLTGKPLSNLAAVCSMMIEMQQKQNLIVHPQWNTQGYPFMRAAHAEAHEAFGYTTWEWWKNQGSNFHDAFRDQKDIAEFHMELVDCLHFLISAHLQKFLGTTSDEPPFAFTNASEHLMYILDRALLKNLDNSWAKHFAEQNDDPTSPEQTLLRVEALTLACLEGRIVDSLEMLVEVAEWTDLGLVGLVGRYFAKATLNQHRWANGYKEKNYIKHWGDGKEDNFYLNRAVIDQLEGLPFSTLLEMLITGMWQETLAEELNDMYGRVQRTGHAYHEAASTVEVS